VASLTAVLDSGMAVPLVVTRPDRPVGRRGEVRPSAIAAFAQMRGLPVRKPEALRGNSELLASIEAVRPDAIAVVAYGRILPSEILRIPPLGCVNVHASLLPRHRGASPVQAAILAGDAETGVVTMRVEESLDAGSVYLERRVPIGERETAGELSARLAPIGGALLVETLRGLAAGNLQARPQSGEPTFSRPVRRSDGEVDWSLDASELSRLLRAYSPWPGLYTFWESERVKILEAEPVRSTGDRPPGTVRLENDALVVEAGVRSGLRLLRVQRAGRRPVTGSEFARGVRLPGRFGAEPR